MKNNKFNFMSAVMGLALGIIITMRDNRLRNMVNYSSKLNIFIFWLIITK